MSRLDTPPPHFPLALRGYDRDAVDAFLNGGGPEAAAQAKRQVERFGERVEAILSAADETAGEVRAEAEDEARRRILGASAKAEEILSEADRRAERLVSDGVRRRRVIEAEITELAAQRDEISERLRVLAREIRLTAVTTTRLEVIDPDEEIPDEEAPDEGEPGEDDLEEFDDLDDDEFEELEDDDGFADDDDDEPALSERLVAPRFQVKESTLARVNGN